MIAEIQGNGWMLFERLVEEDIRLSGIFHPPAGMLLCPVRNGRLDGRNSLITQLRLAGLSFPEPFLLSLKYVLCARQVDPQANRVKPAVNKIFFILYRGLVNGCFV